MKLFRNSTKDEDPDNLDKKSSYQGVYKEKSKQTDELDLIENDNRNPGIQEIYSFCQKDFEKIGYDDALKNPDSSNLEEAIKKIKNDLQILIEETGTYYEDLLDQIELHINMRNQSGLTDLVMQLESRRKQVARHIEKVKEIHRDNNEENGITKGVVLSYKKGFISGLSAISFAEIITKNQ